MSLTVCEHNLMKPFFLLFYCSFPKQTDIETVKFAKTHVCLLGFFCSCDEGSPDRADVKQTKKKRSNRKCVQQGCMCFLGGGGGGGEGGGVLLGKQKPNDKLDRTFNAREL